MYSNLLAKELFNSIKKIIVLGALTFACSHEAKTLPTIIFTIALGMYLHTTAIITITLN